MPVYLYAHPETEVIVEVVQKMNDIHEYSKDGVKYRRVFVNPRTAVDTKADPFSQKDFLRTTQKHMTIGEIMDVSAAMSEQRASRLGSDPLKDKMHSQYKKKTGKEHPDLIGKRKVETKDYVLEY